MTRATLNIYRRAAMRGHLTDSELAERYLLETLYELAGKPQSDAVGALLLTPLRRAVRQG